MKKILFSAVALVTLFTACSKDDDKNATQPFTYKYLLSRASKTDSLSVIYDADLLVTGILHTEKLENGTVDSSYLEPVYAGHIVALNEGRNAEELVKTRSYEYNATSGLLTKFNYLTAQGTISSYDSIFYNAKGQVGGYYSGSGKGETVNYESKTSFTWDSNGNLTKEVKVAMADNEETTDSTLTVYTYDDKKNYLVRLTAFYTIDPQDAATTLSTNNILTSVTQNSNYKDAVTNVYTYDADGYPVTHKLTEVFTSGSTESTYTDEYTLRYRHIKE